MTVMVLQDHIPNLFMLSFVVHYGAREHPFFTINLYCYIVVGFRETVSGVPCMACALAVSWLHLWVSHGLVSLE